MRQLLICCLALALMGCNAYRPIFERYDVEGTVSAPVTSKMSMSAGEHGMSGQEKFAVKLDTATGPKIINCTNTQAGSLEVGDVAQFSCFLEWHAFTPEEEECRFTKLKS